ncbi:histidinol-phosphatase [Variibacter gotjawalensis]|uniref:Histidinol-phosphatase n=1 Tax=Variibacter gotjawalensis TaxID=1333996 RepID=A0A0S3PPQ1_9BRAD|nr:histidinol-phosphatase [Variibacter gotjawalensis]NIK48037.1 myo-inositol-1(or 4)-monophosphatase [Variibacter gotjawalensis]RZS49914.1 myo-inositol-1(or 4)-monophosphatase [Variibacter gotjawalensis]BAT57742.1 histidinol-phosphatase [Variibacter gotjawalensis]
MTAVDFANFVDGLASASGKAILPFFRTSLGVENKAEQGFDPVTAADRAAEVTIRTMIKQTFPTHGIIGEEFDDERTDAEYVWVLDPIDGTKSFISGMLAWGSLIALTRGGTPVYGMMHQPYVGERFTGDGNMARYRGPSGERNLHVRHCATLEDAVLFTTSPLLMSAEDRAKFVTVENVVKLSRYGGDCYAYCMLAAGQLDLVIESGLNAYDIMALIPIVRGAGGIITSWDGGLAEQGGRIIAAGDKRVHEAAMKMLRA